MNNARNLIALRVMTPADVLEVLAVQQPGAALGLAKVFPRTNFPFHERPWDRDGFKRSTRTTLSAS